MVKGCLLILSRLTPTYLPMAGLAEVLPVAVSMRPEIGQSRLSMILLTLTALHKIPDVPNVPRIGMSICSSHRASNLRKQGCHKSLHICIDIVRI